MQGLTGAPVHPGSWFGLPDFGITEWLQGTKSTSPPSNPPPSTPPPSQKAPVTQVKGASTYNAPSAPSSTTPPSSDLPSVIKNAAQSQEDAARAAAEAARQAAQRRYNASVEIGATAKTNATEQYNWLIDTLGSNKEDTLKQVATNTQTSLDAYAKNQEDTQKKYDSSRQEILATYRDLNNQQEKILRGSGQGQSSRSQEAQLRLNTLMGKDLSTLSTQNADALAVIGNAIAGVKSKSADLNNSIEKDTQQKKDQAAFDYKDKIAAIDANMTLSANEKQDAYDAADAALQTNIASINSWAAGLQVQAAQNTAALKEKLDEFILANTNASGALTTSLTDAQKAAAALVAGSANTTLTPGAQGTDTSQGTYQAPAPTKADLDKQLAAGQITQEQYNTQLAALQSSPATLIAAAPTAGATAAPALPNRSSITAGAQTDPLLAAILGRTATA